VKLLPSFDWDVRCARLDALKCNVAVVVRLFVRPTAAFGSIGAQCFVPCRTAPILSD
jgi:hypothetical protein